MDYCQYVCQEIKKKSFINCSFGRCLADSALLQQIFLMEFRSLVAFSDPLMKTVVREKEEEENRFKRN